MSEAPHCAVRSRRVMLSLPRQGAAGSILPCTGSLGRAGAGATTTAPRALRYPRPQRPGQASWILEFDSNAEPALYSGNACTHSIEDDLVVPVRWCLTRIARRTPRPETEREITDGDPTCHKVI